MGFSQLAGGRAFVQGDPGCMEGADDMQPESIAVEPSQRRVLRGDFGRITVLLVALVGLLDDLAVIGVHAKVHGGTPAAVQRGGPGWGV